MDKQPFPANKQAFPALDHDRWILSAGNVGDRLGGAPEPADSDAADASEARVAAGGNPKIGKPISSMMQQDVRTVDGEDTVEKVEEVLAAQSCSSVPVMGSNGVIIGIIGAHELTHFHSEKKNAKAVRAWEISRCTMFEVGPDDSAENVANFMAGNKIEYITVTELGALKGVVSALDLERALSKENFHDTDRASQGEPKHHARRHDD